MRDIFIGLIIAIVCFFIVDFIYTEKNTCWIDKIGVSEPKKCGIIKDKMDIDIYLFERFW